MSKTNITALIKPASGSCNMHCRYCFYKDVSSYRQKQSKERPQLSEIRQEETQKQLSSEAACLMSHATAKALIEKCLSYSDGGEVTFCFQGGEPLLAGYDFFERFVSGVDELNSSECRIHYSLQTNGVLIDERFCEFFHTHDFLLGVSLDGLPEIHDELRCHRNDSSMSDRSHLIENNEPGSYNQITERISLLKKHKVSFNILLVVTPLLAKHFDRVWSSLRDKGYDYLQFINCIAPFGVKQEEWPYALSNEDFADFQCKLFDAYWKENNQGGFVSVRHLDNLLYMLRGYGAEQCTMQGFCAGQLVAEADGSVYPCDFYCIDRYLTGNINRNSLEELSASSAMKCFTTESRVIDDKCKTCSVRGICRGGCRRERDFLGNGQLSLNRYCKGLKQFYEHVLETCR